MTDVSAGRRASGALESDVLGALWAAGRPLTVGEVLRALGDPLAHTTVHTILNRLCDKGVVTREPAPRGHTYAPVLAEPDLAAHRMLRVLADERDRAAVLRRFVADLGPEDEAALAAALARLRGESGSGDGRG